MKITFKIYHRISISFIILYLVIIFLLGFITINISKKYFYDNNTTHLESLLTIVENNLKIANISKNNLNNYIKDIGKNNKERLTIIDSLGKVVADSEIKKSCLDNHISRSEIIMAQKKGKGTSHRFSNSAKEVMVYFAKKIKINHETYYLRASFYEHNLKSFVKHFEHKIIIIFILSILLIIIFSLIISNSISKPINFLINKTKEISEGNYDITFYPFPVYEIEKLNNAFQTMLNKISQLIKDLSQNRIFLQSIIENIQEPLLLIDNKGNVIISNLAFSNWINKNSDNKKYFDYINKIEIINIINEQLKKGKTYQYNLKINDFFYDCNVAKINDGDFYLFTFYDITKFKQLEIMKKQFIANVSHELRTPLTSIKGFTETLQEELKGEQLKYCNTIIKNTERMILIINDLLLLSNLEQNKENTDFNDFNLYYSIENVYKILYPKIKLKNLKININCPKDLTLWGDKFKIEQVLINLIDNAVRYTDNGKIVINAFQKNNNTILEIIDKGIGIEKIYQNRIFERFFVIDKSRSRESGGTGLGLSIVKHILNLHNAKISIESEIKKGSCFRITFFGK